MSDLDTLSGLSQFGEAEAAAVARLSSQILSWTDHAVAQHTGRDFTASLTAAKSGLPDAALLHQAQSRADAGQARLEALIGLRDAISPLRLRVTGDLEILRRLPPFQGTDRLEKQGRQALLEAKRIHFEGLLASLERCRLVTDRLVSAERLAQDQLSLARDVTAPVAVREAHFTLLTEAADASKALLAEADRQCSALLQSGFAAPAPAHLPGEDFIARFIRRRHDV